MLSADDKRRIEEEERYRAQIRQQLGPTETTTNVRFRGIIGFFILVLVMIMLAPFVLGILSVMDTSDPHPHPPATPLVGRR